MRNFYYIILFFISFSSLVYSDDAPIMPMQSGDVIPVESKDIKMVDERIDIYLYKSNYKVEVNYNFLNT